MAQQASSCAARQALASLAQADRLRRSSGAPAARRDLVISREGASAVFRKRSFLPGEARPDARSAACAPKARLTRAKRAP